MKLEKTIILPLGNPQEACRLLHEAIYLKPWIIFLAFDADGPAEELVQMADGLAGAPTDPRYVVWARSRKDIKSELEALEGPPKLLKQLPTARSCSVGLSNTVRDVISADETGADLVRVEKSYLKAEASQPTP